jgi:hypothetical protein
MTAQVTLYCFAVLMLTTRGVILRQDPRLFSHLFGEIRACGDLPTPPPPHNPTPMQARLPHRRRDTVSRKDRRY